jgi:hypothetical protein
MCDLDRSGDVWLYRPPHHKTAHRGKRRTIAIGPRAQKALEPFITDDPEAYVFSPARAVAEVRAERAANRKTPRYPSEAKRRARSKVKNPRRRAASKYTTHAYSVAISRACEAAHPLPADLAPRKKEDGTIETPKEWRARLSAKEQKRVKDWRAAHHWHPNQLRHTFATLARKKYGLEAAQVLLGHSRADVTQVYAERDEAAAVRVAGEIG